MSDFPHIYKNRSVASQQGLLTSSGENLPDLQVAPPTQFGGPGDQWSPEDLFVAAISNCFVLSFRAIAQASKFEWVDIDCEAAGVLDKVERKLLFTKVTTKVTLTIADAADKEKAERLIEKAEAACLVNNSLACEKALEFEVVCAS